MIQDVDETLRGLVRDEALDGDQVEIAFDAPTHEWVARRNAPAVDLYLYDIREDLMRREVQWEPQRTEAGLVDHWQPPARRYKLAYMVTAWTQRPEDEHRILSGLLSCFLRHEHLPPEQLAGDLAKQPLPLYVTVALPLTSDRSIADVWSALGGELKPSLDLVVSTPFVDTRTSAAGPPVRELPRISVSGELTNGHGSSRAGARGGARGRGAADLGEAIEEPSEDRQAGKADAPGRVVRLRGLRR
ncbi:MAG TPA: DUF4255 domain-containing protein [Candidatus Eisenbacteria bacterium]|nr:DUF4255 domain-containing protein [Candidatus Eisenbacteria bacterium]